MDDEQGNVHAAVDKAGKGEQREQGGTQPASKGNMTIDIAPFSIDLYDDVYALWRQCEGVGLSEADARGNIRAYLERNPGMSFVALAGGRVVGAILAGHDGRRGYVHHLAVHPSLRRHGIARRLVERAVCVLRSAGILYHFDPIAVPPG